MVARKGDTDAPNDQSTFESFDSNDRESDETKLKRQNFKDFQSMLTGGWADNGCAPDYKTACANLHMDPKDPHYMVDGVKCSLKPWQVIGVDWLRSCRALSGINPLLADDCGLGKTLQGLGGVYAEYLKAKSLPPEEQVGPYRPTLILCPRILALNWLADNKNLLNNGLEVFMWAGRAADAGDLIDHDRIIDGTVEDLAKTIKRLDPADPETARKVFVTSYNTGWQRGLLQDGGRVKTEKDKKAEAEDKRAEAEAKLNSKIRRAVNRRAIPDPDDEDAAEQQGEEDLSEKDQSAVFSTVLEGKLSEPTASQPPW